MDSSQRQIRPTACPRRSAWRFSALVVVGGSILAACSSSSKTPTGPLPGAAVKIAASTSTTQTGLLSQSVSIKPSVKVTDANGIGVPSASVTFALTGGGGSFTGPNQLTDANGIATVGSWTLGAARGSNTMSATASGLTGSPVLFSVFGDTVASQFNIQLQYITTATVAQQTAFNDAAARWSQVITGDLGGVNVVNADVSVCGAPAGTLVNGLVNDLRIVVQLDSIDGPGKILGAATPCYTRNGGRQLTLIGYMVFDTFDLAGLEASGDLNDVILHEMGHVLGFGTFWEPPSPDSLLTTTPTIVGSTLGFFGPNAVTAYTGSNGGTGTRVPVEDGNTPGTSRSHWKESVFLSELMTGFISGTVHPLSLTTVQSLADLGYTVNPLAADPFNINTQPTLRAGQPGPVYELQNDIIRVPRRYIDERTGRVVPGLTH